MESQRQQLLEDLKRFEESERKAETDTQKRQSDIKKEKKKAQEIRKKNQWKDLQGHENVRSKMKVTLQIKTKLKFQLRSG